MSSQSLPTQAQLDGALTAFGRDLGTGTAFPTQGPAASALRRGDAYYHATYGALFVWTGTGWRSRGPGELTAAQRTALVTANIPYAGFQVWETDTKALWTWNGTIWTGGGPVTARLRVSDAAGVNSWPSGSYSSVTLAAIDTTQGDILTGITWAAGSPTRLTIQRAGTYLIGGAIGFANNGTGERIATLYLNGVALPGSAATGKPPGAYFHTMPLPAQLVPLAVGDYVEVYVNQNSGLTLGPSVTNTNQGGRLVVTRWSD